MYHLRPNGTLRSFNYLLFLQQVSFFGVLFTLGRNFLKLDVTECSWARNLGIPAFSAHRWQRHESDFRVAYLPSSNFDQYWLILSPTSCLFYSYYSSWPQFLLDANITEHVWSQCSAFGINNIQNLQLLKRRTVHTPSVSPLLTPLVHSLVKILLFNTTLSVPARFRTRSHLFSMQVLHWTRPLASMSFSKRTM